MKLVRGPQRQIPHLFINGAELLLLDYNERCSNTNGHTITITILAEQVELEKPNANETQT
jgi:hypothetical protein